jgi:hypothetical protein
VISDYREVATVVLSAGVRAIAGIAIIVQTPVKTNA